MKIAFLEFIDEFKALREYARRKGMDMGDFLVIALEPKLGAYLRGQGIPCRNTLPYLRNDSHGTILMETEKVMRQIRQKFDFTDVNGLRKCYQKEYAHYMRVFMNHMLKLTEIIGNVCGEREDAELYAAVRYDVDRGPLIGETEERYCGLLVQGFAEKNGLKFFDINEGSARRGQAPRRRRQFYFAERSFLMATIWLLRKKKNVFIPSIRGVFRDLICRMSERDRGLVFLAIDSRENLLKVFLLNLCLWIQAVLFREKPRRVSMNPDFFHPRVPHEEEQRLMKAIDGAVDGDGRKLFVYRGVDYYLMIRRKIDISWKPHLKTMLSGSYALRYMLAACDKSLVMSYAGLGVMGVAGELARVMKKRSLFVSHGTHPVPIDALHELELNNLCRSFMLGDYTHVALSTPVQEAHLRYFKDKYRDITNEEIKTGPLVFARVSKNERSLWKKNAGIDPDTAVITHAVTTKARIGERFYFLETLDEFLSSLHDLVDTVNELGRVKLVIRVHPGFYLSDEEIRTFLPASDKYIIHRYGPFSEVLGATDVLISYSSTTIDEALISGIPVLLYDKWKRYNHFMTDAFDPGKEGNYFPVCYVSGKEYFKDAIASMLKKSDAVRKHETDFTQYVYNGDHGDRFFSFIGESLKGGVR